MLSLAQKKYLYAIYKLSRSGLPATTTDVSAMVGVSKASTVKMNRRLSEEGYISKERYGRITLTDKGEAAAAELFCGSGTLCRFLRERLGVDGKTAEKESAVMVSHLSEGTLEKLLSFIQEVQ